MSTPELAQARTAYRERSWRRAVEHFAAADKVAPLGPQDLESWATAGYLAGQDQLWDGMARAFHARLEAGEIEAAARCAFWLGFWLQNRGQAAQATGWLRRASRLLDDAGLDSVVRGYLLLVTAHARISAGDIDGAVSAFAEAGGVGGRFGDVELVTYARHAVGRGLINLGRPAEGAALLDEAMVAVTAGEVSPVMAGIVYCSVIEACRESFDVARAQEWTDALTRWCAQQTDLVPFGGQCLVHRTELLQLNGAWAEALREVQSACAHFARTPQEPAVGAAHYQLGELQRLRGDLAAAERAYHDAGLAGHEPLPGLALLCLAQGRPDAAEAALRRALGEWRSPAVRPRLLAALAQVLIESSRAEEAREAVEELTETATRVGAPLLRAMARACAGAVRLATGDATSALSLLREAWAAWQELDVPYEAARTRVQLAMACRALGDEESAAIEFEAAAEAFQRLGATTDLATVRGLVGSSPGARRAGTPALSPREHEVIRLMVTGRTNRAIAAELYLSEKTVARHVSNILAKLGVPSRAAATAWAYEHHMV